MLQPGRQHPEEPNKGRNRVIIGLGGRVEFRWKWNEAVLIGSKQTSLCGEGLTFDLGWEANSWSCFLGHHKVKTNIELLCPEAPYLKLCTWASNPGCFSVSNLAPTHQTRGECSVLPDMISKSFWQSLVLGNEVSQHCVFGINWQKKVWQLHVSQESLDASITSMWGPSSAPGFPWQCDPSSLGPILLWAFIRTMSQVSFHASRPDWNLEGPAQVGVILLCPFLAQNTSRCSVHVHWL